MSNSGGESGSRRLTRFHLLILLALPAVLLVESLFGGKQYLPFDLAEFPPVATLLEPEQVEALRENANYDATEPPVWFVPEMELARGALARGEYPHWNPFVRGGAPLTAHGHLGLHDPLHWPALLHEDPADGLALLTWLMFALAGLLMYGFLRELGLDELPALFGAIAFSLSGTLTANGHWYMRMEPLAMLPGLLWAALRMRRVTGTARVLPAAGFAVALALCWLAGFPPFCLPVTLLAVVFCAFIVLVAWRTDGHRQAIELAGWLGAAGALGLCLAASQVLQQLAFFPVSNRPPDPDLSVIGRYAFDPMGLLGYLMPDPFGHPGDPSLPYSKSPLAYALSSLTEWGGSGRPRLPNYVFTEYAVFPGLLTLVLAAVGVLGRRTPLRWMAAGTLGALLLLATGIGPLRHLYQLPVLSAIPPMRFMGPACLFVAWLAALGCQDLLAGASRRIAVGVGVTALLLGAVMFLLADGAARSEGPPTQDPWVQTAVEKYRVLAPDPETITPELVVQRYFTNARGEDLVALGRQRLQRNLRRAGSGLLLAAVWMLLWSVRRGDRRWAVALLAAAVAVTTVELFAFGFPLNRGRYTPHPLQTPVHEFLRGQRDALADRGGFMVARAHTVPVGPWHLPPGTLAKDGIRDLHFYTFVDRNSCLPLFRIYPQDVDRDGNLDMFTKEYYPLALPDDPRLQLPWWDAIGLRFLLSTVELNHAGTEVHRLRGPGGTFFVYERETALPRAWVVPDLGVLPDEEQVVAAAVRPDWDPRVEALVTGDEATRLGTVTPDPAAAERDARFTLDEPTDVRIRVSEGPAGYLLVSDTWLPGWQVTVDGEPEHLGRANAFMRAVRLPKKDCEVRFTYSTPGLLPGTAISLLALLLLGVVVAMRLRRSRT